MNDPAGRPPAATLEFDGVVDFVTAPEIQQRGVELMATPGLHTLVADLAKVTFIDSSGLSLLVYLKGRCDERGVQLELQHVPRRARALIDSLGLGAYFALN
jgi:anti-sigma B factor antagonist